MNEWGVLTAGRVSSVGESQYGGERLEPHRKQLPTDNATQRPQNTRFVQLNQPDRQRRPSTPQHAVSND